LGSPEYVAYHDSEWGRPVVDETRLFEKISLEGFQSGLSWITVLRKRENFRTAFKNFEPAEVAGFSASTVDALLLNAGIIRHRGKIEAVVNNAQRFLELHTSGESLSGIVWQYADPAEKLTAALSRPIPAQTSQSLALSKDLKKRGWKFVGPTTMYAFMQSMGLVNDHATGCHVRAECEKERAEILR
jgi:DNA-3-methyladenine glycosylase I